MASTINASSAGIVETADNSGVLQLQTNGVQALNVDTSQNVTIPKNLTVNGTFSGNLSSISSSGNIISTGGYVECTNGGYSALQTNSVTIGNSTTGLYYNGSNAIGLQVNNVSKFGFGQTGTFVWNSYQIPAPTGSTTTYLRNDGTWATPAGGGGGGASLTADQTFTGANTFSQVVTCSISGNYSALGSNSVEFGNAQTGIFYNGAGGVGLQIDNNPLFGWYSNGNFLWGGTYSIACPTGNTTTYLRNDGTWVSPTAGFLGASNTFTGANIFNNTYTYFGGSSSSNSMILEANSINWYNSITGNQYNSIYYTASSTSLNSQQYVFNFNNSGSAQSAFIFAGDGGAYKTGGGSWGTVSDSRLKSNVNPLTGALAKISALNPVSYLWNYDATGEPTVGFIAQEVQKVIPNAVNTITPTDAQKPFINDDQLLSIAWQNDMTAYLVGAIKELNAEIEILKAKVGA